LGRKTRRGLLGLGVVLLAVVALVAGSLGLVTAVSQPTQAGSLDVRGLHSPVEISRDLNGIAQITAADQHDLFFAQGWLHASERLWQMEVWRLIGAGRLAEVLGSDALSKDVFIRTLDWRGAAERDYAALSDDARSVLGAYSDGVTAYMDGHPGLLGAPFAIVALKSGLGDPLGGYRPERWSPIDVLTFAKLQAWSLGGNMDSEIFRMVEDARLGDPRLTDELFPDYPADRPVIASPGQTGLGAAATSAPTLAATSTPAATRTASPAGEGPTRSAPSMPADIAAAWADIAATAASVTSWAGLDQPHGLVGSGGIGSNNWVVGGSYTASGRPMLANDPHLGFNMPAVWYVNGLHCAPVGDACPYDVTGVTFPGTPGVIAGRNARIAWGVTNVNPDVQDLVMERADPADPGKYLTASGPVAFTVRTEQIKVAGGDPVTLTVRETSHGPIVNDADARLRGDQTLFALRWTAISQPDRILESFLRIDRAQDWTEFRDALRLYGTPSQNFVYADADGNIGYQMPGAIPVRSDPADHGLRPVPGWDGKHEWTSFIPFDRLPSVLNPPSGRIVTANNAVDAGALFIGAEYDRGDRAARITQLLDAAKGSVTAQTMGAVQGDTTLLRGLRMQAALRAMGPRPDTPDGQAVLDGILAWDGACTVDSTGCTAFSTFELAIERAIFDDDLGPYAASYAGTDWANDLAATLIGTPEGRASAWWGDRRAGTGADAAGVTAMALDAAGGWLRRDLGDPAAWAWGRVHRIQFRELTFGSAGIGPLDWLFDTDAFPVNGAAGAPDNTSYSLGAAYPDPVDGSGPEATSLAGVFSVTLGPSMRAIYDLADPDRSRIAITTGQSGVPLSAHNTDFVAKWLANQTVPLPFTPGAISRTSVATLVLRPAP